MLGKGLLDVQIAEAEISSYIATSWRPVITSYTSSGILLQSLHPSPCLPFILLDFFILCSQFHHQNPNLFICCLLCLTNIWVPFGSAPGDIWLPDRWLPENSLPCWIHLLIWDPPFGILLETCLVCMGKLCPMFLARSRHRVAEDNSKCVLGFVPGALSLRQCVLGWLWRDVHKAGCRRRLQPQISSQPCLYLFTKNSIICILWDFTEYSF